MIYAKFYCNRTTNFFIAMKLYVNHLQYLKNLQKIEIFCRYFLIIFPLKFLFLFFIKIIFDPASKAFAKFFVLLLNATFRIVCNFLIVFKICIIYL